MRSGFYFKIIEPRFFPIGSFYLKFHIVSFSGVYVGVGIGVDVKEGIDVYVGVGVGDGCVSGLV